MAVGLENQVLLKLSVLVYKDELSLLVKLTQMTAVVLINPKFQNGKFREIMASNQFKLFLIYLI
jgi:hypothetical protein